MMLTQAGTPVEFTRAHCEVTLSSILAQRDQSKLLLVFEIGSVTAGGFV